MLNVMGSEKYKTSVNTNNLKIPTILAIISGFFSVLSKLSFNNFLP